MLDFGLMEAINEISVFFPAYNEEKNIAKTVRDAEKVLNKNFRDWEIIIVNDGSSDKTGRIAQELAKDEKIRVVNHPFNKGYGEALKSGFYSSRKEWIATVDADGQFDFQDILLLGQKANQADVVIGYRIGRKDSLLRRLFGVGWTFLARILLGIKVRDVDCSFKLVKKQVIDSIPKLESTRGGMISPELLAKAQKAGFKIAEVGVHHFPRKHGKQTGADIKVIVKSFVDMIKLWQKIR